MAIHDFRAERLFVRDDLAAGVTILCSEAQTHYLMTVLRLKVADELYVFNGRDGEWLVKIAQSRKKSCVLEALHQVRPQQDGPDIDYLFAPLKRARLDYMVQKAVEMGVARLRPIFTHYTNVQRINLDRMRANVIEAAEQCGILRLPDVFEPVRFEMAMSSLASDRTLIFCDEDADVSDPIVQLSKVKRGPLAVLIGPEGGFSPDERSSLHHRPRVVRLSLGPRIMRADTAAVAALALVNSVAGDWRSDDQVSTVGMD